MDEIRAEMFKNFKYDTATIRQLIKAYTTGLPAQRMYYWVRPADFLKYFRDIRFIKHDKNIDEAPHFVLTHNFEPLTQFKLYVKVIEIRNYIGNVHYFFKLEKIEYSYSINGKSEIMKLKDRSLNSEPIRQVFEILLNDLTLEEVYLQSYTD